MKILIENSGLVITADWPPGFASAKGICLRRRLGKFINQAAAGMKGVVEVVVAVREVNSNSKIKKRAIHGGTGPCLTPLA